MVRERGGAVERPEPANLFVVIERAAADPNVDVEKMERLFALQERLLARQAEEDFNNAMSKVQSEIEPIVRDAKNSHTQSAYARLETIHAAIVPIYTRHRFSLKFGTADSPRQDEVRITCKVSRGGHTEPHQADLPYDLTGAKGTANKPRVQAYGSSLSYGRRYLTLLIFNVPLKNEDDDGNAGRAPKPQGPSTVAAEPSVKDLARVLWNLLTPVRGAEQNWNAANQWMWDEGVLDDTEAAPNLSAERFVRATNAARSKLSK